MQSADRFKFTATPATVGSAATLNVSAAISGYRTPAQVISDSASDPLGIKVGATGLCFTSDDGAGNKETSLYTLTTATQLTRTEVQSSTAGGTTPATFTGSSLTVTNALSGKQASRLPSVSVDASGNAIGLLDPKGNALALGSMTLPSGDTTGVNDTAAMDSALALNGRLVLQAGATYYRTAPVVVGSNQSISAYGAKIILVSGYTGNIIRNKAVMPSKTVTDASVVGAGQSGNATFTSLTANFGTAGAGQIGDMVGIFGAGQGTSNGATPPAWYAKIVALITPANATAWSASAARAVGDLRRPSTANTYLYQVTTAGTTAAAEPTWPTATGSTVVDGGVTWTCLGQATGATLSVPALTNVTGATANIFFASDRNDNITIQGGSWQVVDMMLSGHNAAATIQNSFVTAFRRVSNLRIHDATFTSNTGSGSTEFNMGAYQGGGGRFTISIADYQNVTVTGCTLNNTSGDGVHLTGPGDAALIANIKAFNVGDDCIVTNLQDSNTPYTSDTEGSISNTTVRDIYARGGKSRTFCHYETGSRASTTPVRWYMTNLHVDKVYGEQNGSIVAVFQSATGINIKNIVGKTNTTNASTVHAGVPLVWIGNDNGPWHGGTIEDVTWMGDNTADSGIVMIVDPRGPWRVKNLRMGVQTSGANTDPNIGLLIKGSIVGSTYGAPAIDYDGFYTGSVTNGNVAGTTQGSQQPPAYCTALYFGNTVSSTGGNCHINMRNIIHTSPAGFLFDKSSPASTPRVSISDSYLASGAAPTGTGAAAVARVCASDPAIFFNFYNVRSFAALVITQSPLTVDMVNCDQNSGFALIQIVGSGSSGTIRTVNSSQAGSGPLFSRDGTQSVRVRGTDFPVDQTLLNPSDGDMIYNSNATPGNGTGVAIYNTAAAKWKNLYSGLTN